MITLRNVVALQTFVFIVLPVLGWCLVGAFGVAGSFLYLFLLVLWCWELFAFVHYRYCRQEELLYVLQTAAETQAPMEVVLKAYAADRPRLGLYDFWQFMLLFCVFPGHYFAHREQSFDSRIRRLVARLENGVPLDVALRSIPGLVSREIALAVTVGHFTGRLAQALHHLPDRRSMPLLLELVPRLLYPLLILNAMLSTLTYIMIFLIPKFEMIFAEFHMKLPWLTQNVLEVSRWGVALYGMLLPIPWLLLILVNVLVFSSQAKWHCPLLGRLYRMYARGQFLQMLGLMLETGKPLAAILDHVLDSGLLPKAIEVRVDRLALDLYEGQPLPASLAKHGLAIESMAGLIATAEKVQNLPWALQELGDSLVRRSVRLSYQVAMIVFPLSIMACACVVGVVAVAMFEPLIAMLEGLHG